MELGFLSFLVEATDDRFSARVAADLCGALNITP